MPLLRIQSLVLRLLERGLISVLGNLPVSLQVVRLRGLLAFEAESGLSEGLGGLVALRGGLAAAPPASIAGDRVCSFQLERPYALVVLHHALYCCLYRWVLHNLLEVRALGRLFLEEAADQVVHIFTIHSRYFALLPRSNLLDQLAVVFALERVLEGAHLVEKDAEGPDVRLRIIRLPFAHLRRIVVRCADDRGRPRLRRR